MKVQFSGRVFSGQGEGRTYIMRSWVRRQIEEKLNFTPYPGTLNLKLTGENAKKRSLLVKTPTLKVCASEGYCSGSLFKASIGELDCAVVIPDIEDYLIDVLEIIARPNLREKLHLRDGDNITVIVSV